MTNKLRHALFPLLASLFCLVGCTEEVVDPVIEIPEKRSIAVVPFRDPNFDVGFESPLGRELASNVAKKLRDQGEYTVVPTSKVFGLYKEPSADEIHIPPPPAARDIAHATGADYVIMASVVHWSLRDEDMIPGGLLRGSATIEVSIYETYDGACARAKSDKDKEELPPLGKGHIVVAKRRVEAVFPREYGMSKIGTTEMSAQQIEEGLKLAAAQSVAWLLVSHTKDEEKHAEGK